MLLHVIPSVSHHNLSFKVDDGDGSTKSYSRKLDYMCGGITIAGVLVMTSSRVRRSQERHMNEEDVKHRMWVGPSGHLLMKT